MTTEPLSVSNSNLSHAWATAFLSSLVPSTREIVPLTLTVGGFREGHPIEDETIRAALDEALIALRLPACNTVASTIFPETMWNPRRPRAELFERYLRLLPSIKKSRPHLNNKGTYFSRLIAYGGGETPRNQLESILSRYTERNGVRRSVLQLTTFDPAIDQSGSARQSFPCMQQLSFAPFGDGQLSVNAFYATQFLFEKAYGNYLGICRLGRFVAHELGLELTRLTCFTGIALPNGSIPKARLNPLLRRLEVLIEDTKPTRSNDPIKRVSGNLL